MMIRRWVALAAVALALVLGCSDSDSSGSSCTDSEECPAWRCTCGNGQSIDAASCMMGRCGRADDSCGGMCEDNGGLASVTQVPTLAGTTECTSVCDKLAAMNCGEHHSCVHRYCDIGSGSCEASVREELVCMMSDKATWSCQGTFASVTGCWSSVSACAPDAGSD